MLLVLIWMPCLFSASYFQKTHYLFFFFYPLEQKWQDLTINWNKYKIVFIDILVDID